MAYQPHLKYIREFIKRSETKPVALEDVKSWIECEGLGRFLQATSEDWVLVHLITKDYFCNSFLVLNESKDKYQGKSVLEVGDYSLMSGSAGYGYSSYEGKREYFFDKVSKAGPEDTEMLPLFFYRSFEGYKKEDTHYYEIIQEFIHFADLHWVEERSAFCALNEVGDLEEKIVIISEEKFSAIIFERNELERYLLCRKVFVCRLLEIQRAMPKADWIPRSGRADPTYQHSKDRNSWIRLTPITEEDLSFACDLVRASDLVFPARTMEELESSTDRYESFIIQDWKNKKIVECSCDPLATDSYFSDTGKPFQTSPVFFKADVLLKYKSEPEKYELKERSLYCRGAWSLQTYDINEEGQVHTYIRYLGYLPYREQLHWKQFNEPPKGKISDRSFKTDFEAKWSDDYNPLQNIKKHFEAFPSFDKSGDLHVIWKPKDKLESLVSKIHYVSAGKTSEYKDFLLALTILVVDGFDVQSLRNLTKEHKSFNAQMGSLGCLKLFLLQRNTSIEEADEILRPLRDLQEKRSKYAGHGGAQPNFDLVEDCRKTLESIDASIEKIVSILKNK